MGRKHKPPAPPWRQALYAGLTTLAAGFVIGLVTVMVIGSDDYYAAGEKLGQGLGQLSVLVGVVAYLGARRRAKKRKQLDQSHLDDVFR